MGLGTGEAHKWHARAWQQHWLMEAKNRVRELSEPEVLAVKLIPYQKLELENVASKVKGLSKP